MGRHVPPSGRSRIHMHTLLRLARARDMPECPAARAVRDGHDRAPRTGPAAARSVTCQAQATCGITKVQLCQLTPQPKHDAAPRHSHRSWPNTLRPWCCSSVCQIGRASWDPTLLRTCCCGRAARTERRPCTAGRVLRGVANVAGLGLYCSHICPVQAADKLELSELTAVSPLDG
jgi:hypothetical protein